MIKLQCGGFISWLYQKLLCACLWGLCNESRGNGSMKVLGSFEKCSCSLSLWKSYFSDSLINAGPTSCWNRSAVLWKPILNVCPHKSTSRTCVCAQEMALQVLVLTAVWSWRWEAQRESKRNEKIILVLIFLWKLKNVVQTFAAHNSVCAVQVVWDEFFPCSRAGGRPLSHYRMHRLWRPRRPAEVGLGPILLAWG